MTMKPSDLSNWWHYYKLPDGTEIKREDNRGLELPHYPENLWQMVMPYVESMEGKKVLDIGSNSGWFSIKFCQLGASVVGVDNQQMSTVYDNDDRVAQSNLVADLILTPDEKKRIKFVKADFLDVYPQQGDEYDAVWFFGVYYHLPDHKKALPKINSIMKKGGVLYLESAVNATKCYDKTTIGAISNDPSNFFVPTIDYLRHDLMDNGFAIVAECDVSRPNVGTRYFFKAIKR